MSGDRQMKVLYYNSPQSHGSDPITDLTALGYQLVPLTDEELPGPLDICLLIAPSDLAEAVSAIHDVRRLLLPQ